MGRYEDPDWPSRATGAGQEVRFARDLGNGGRAGKAFAYFWLLAILASFLFFVTMVLTG